MTESQGATGGGPIVVGYDGREESERALSRAFDEARSRGVAVVAVVVANFPYEVADPLQPGLMSPGPIEPIPAEGPFEIQPLLEDARGRIAAAGVEGTVQWGLGDVVLELLRVAKEQNAAAIVVGTHHHSALGRLLGTDTAADLVRDAECEVLVA